MLNFALFEKNIYFFESCRSPWGGVEFFLDKMRVVTFWNGVGSSNLAELLCDVSNFDGRIFHLLKCPHIS